MQIMKCNKSFIVGISAGRCTGSYQMYVELLERDDTEELNHNIHIDLPKNPPPPAISSRV